MTENTGTAVVERKPQGRCLSTEHNFMATVVEVVQSGTLPRHKTVLYCSKCGTTIEVQ